MSDRASRVRRRLIVLAGLVPVIVTAALAVTHPPAFSRLDDAVYDTVVRSSSARTPVGRVAIVDVDDRSLATIGQWPWRRDVMGRLITGLKDAGAAVIAMDVIFAESDRHDLASDDPGSSAPTSSDRALASIIGDPRVVLGYGLTFDPRGTPTDKCALHTLPVAVVQRGDDSTPPFFRATGAVCNIPVLARAAVRSGYLNAAPDSDGVLRRVPLMAELEGRILPSLALSAVSALNGWENPSLDVSTVNSSTLTISSVALPLDGRSNLLLAFRGKKRTFPYISAADVLDGTVDREALRGKIVLVGTTALGTREVVATPLDTQFVGVEVQATTIDNLLQQDVAHRSVYATVIDLLLVVAGGTAVAVLCATAGMTAGVLGAAGLIVAFWSGAPWLLGSQRVFVSPLFPTLAVVGTLSVMTLARFTVERRRATKADVDRTAAQGLMIQTLLALTETRDAETGRHSRRTQQYARLLAEPLSTHPAFRDYLTKERVELLSRLAPLHDIGKVGIPDAVLNKPGKLTPDELAQMRRHPELGRDVILRAESRVGVRDDATLQLAKDIVYTHHERWDGKGYPQGLTGTDIPIPGRIMAVVDVYDAVHARSLYCASSSHEETVKVIERGRGTHFDPDVVDAFLQVSQDFERVSAQAID